MLFGAIGSAKTERIEINVEQTKKAVANKNNVPIAFLQEFALIRIFIEKSPALLSQATNADFPANIANNNLHLLKV